MLSSKDSWTVTLVCATLAIGFASAGLLVTTLAPGAAPLAMSALLVASLGCTGGSFTLVALRVRRLELENEGLIEEIAQEFDRVKDRMDVYAEALVHDPEEETRATHRVVVK